MKKWLTIVVVAMYEGTAASKRRH